MADLEGLRRAMDDDLRKVEQRIVGKTVSRIKLETLNGGEFDCLAIGFTDGTELEISSMASGSGSAILLEAS